MQYRANACVRRTRGLESLQDHFIVKPTGNRIFFYKIRVATFTTRILTTRIQYNIFV